MSKIEMTLAAPSHRLNYYAFYALQSVTTRVESSRKVRSLPARPGHFQVTHKGKKMIEMLLL
jgi:hypothetical protein